MKRPVLLIVGAVAGALMIAIAGVGASAHSSTKLTKSVSQGASVLSDESSQNQDTLQPADALEVKAPEPTTTQATTETEVEANDTETDVDVETNDETEAPAQATTSAEKENGDKKEASNGAEKD